MIKFKIIEGLFFMSKQKKFVNMILHSLSEIRKSKIV